MKISGVDRRSQRRHGQTDTSWKASLLSLMLLVEVRAIGTADFWKGSQHDKASKNMPTNVPSSVKIVSFDLQPTSALAVERQRRRLKARNKTTSSHETLWDQIQADWFHPRHNAIYATLPKQDDPLYHNLTMDDEDSEDHDNLLKDFHKYRHLSRYERQYRSEKGLDLQPNWDGIYDFYDDFDTDDNHDHLNSDGKIDLENDDPTSINISKVATNYTEQSIQERRLQSSSASSHFGGRFNNYQDVALSQGYGTHYCTAWIGSPTPQRKTLIVDTGSHYTAFPCTGCRNCGWQHHTDPYFAPEKSETFHVLNCNECREGVACQDNKCVFSQSYTEGSSWEAYQVRDRFYCGGNDFLGAVDPNDQQYAVQFMFGCQRSTNGLFVSQLADGIIGMSMYDTTLTKQMYTHGKLEHNIFALCYRRELGSSKRGVSAGSMTLGGVSNSLDTSPLIYAKNMATIGFYTVYVKAIWIRAGGGQSAKTPSEGDYLMHKVPLNVHKVNSGKGVIVDSGTTDTYLNKNMARSFNKMWKKVTGREYAHSPISLNDEQLKSLPTILVQCQAYDMRIDPSLKDLENLVGYAGRLDPSSPNDLVIAIPATNYMEFSPRTKQYASRVYFTETSGGVLGSNTMQGHNVVFDWENGRVGFAESSCTYDRKSSPKEYEQFAVDCALSEPVLSQACIETVEQQVCDNDPSNVALLGTETWTMLVEHPGTEAGVSCAEVAKRQTPLSEIGESSISCEGNGFCTEVRPCQLPCKELSKAKEVTQSTVKDVSASTKKCGDLFWGACDYKCNQTRITADLFTDGSCHEVARDTRWCHKDACGRSDPCRVPFIVHAIYVLRGVSYSGWTKKEDDIFSEALAQTFESLSLATDAVLFRVGDVKIVLTRPWLDDDEVESFKSADNEDFTREELGIKVVVQISIYNPNFQLTDSETRLSETSDTGLSNDIGQMVRNVTGALHSNPDLPTACKDADLFALAKNARSVAFGIPENPNFMHKIIGAIQYQVSESGDESVSTFAPLFRDDTLASQSRLMSSWTIRTDVDDEINYFGPPEPLFFTVLRYVHRIALITFCFSLFVFMWGVAVQSMDFLFAAFHTGKSWLPGGRTSDPAYEPHLGMDFEHESVNRIEEKKRGGFSSIRRRFSIGRHKSESILPDKKVSRTVELTPLVSKKRRNSGNFAESEHNLDHQVSM